MARKQKSLRQLTQELRVSHYYISQIIHGKRPANEKVVSKKMAGAYGGRTHRRHGQCLPTDLKSAKPTGTQTLPYLFDVLTAC